MTNPKDCGAPKKKNPKKGPFLPLIQRGFAELDTDTRYQGDEKPSEESVFNSAQRYSPFPFSTTDDSAFESLSFHTKNSGRLL